MKTVRQNPLHCGDRCCLLLATALGLGLSPIGPGTCGTLLGILIQLVVVLLLPLALQWAALVLCLLAVAALNILVAPWASRYWRAKDPKHFVLDEVAGYLMVPVLFHQGQLWQIMLWGFVLFRICDIVKIPPASQIDRHMHGPLGILLDDLVAGLYAAAGMYLLAALSSHLHLGSWLIQNSLP